MAMGSAVQGGTYRLSSKRWAKRTAWLSKHRVFVVELLILVVFLSVSVGGPWLVTTKPEEQILARMRERPNAGALLGRDELGRDILARLVHGSRYTLGIGFTTVMIGLVCGGALGLISGYYGKWADVLIMRVMDMMLAFPSILLAIVMIAILGAGLLNVVVAVGIYFIPIFARLVRALTLRLREEQFVTAARATGARDHRIILRHLLPNVLPTLVVQATVSLAEGILYVTGLGFLGLGVQAPTPEWGVMLSRARDVMFVAPHVAIMPGLALTLLLLTINLLGDALRDLLDPRLRGSR